MKRSVYAAATSLFLIVYGEYIIPQKNSVYIQEQSNTETFNKTGSLESRLPCRFSKVSLYAMELFRNLDLSAD